MLRRFTGIYPAPGPRFGQYSVELIGEGLRAWDGWTVPARRYLQGKESVVLLPLLQDHATTVVEGNRWLLTQLAGQLPVLAPEYDALVVRANAVLTGLDIEGARQLTERRTRQAFSTEEPPVSL